MAIIRYRDGNGKVIPLYCIKGDNGNQMYVRFSAYADGTDMSEKWDAERNFMGIAFAYETPTEKEQYQWISLADISLGHYAEEGSEDKYLFFVGNGTDEENRSNALTLDAEGVMWLLGDLLIGEERMSVLEEFEAVKTRASGLGDRADALEKCVPAWNVDGNIGPISPLTKFENGLKMSDCGLKFTDDKFSVGETTVFEGEEKAFSFPCINTGKVYLDFKDTFSPAMLQQPESYTFPAYSWKTVIAIFINDNLIAEYAMNYKTSTVAEDISADYVFTKSNVANIEDLGSVGSYCRDGWLGTVETARRTLLEVNIGDIVTITSKVITTRHRASYDNCTIYSSEYSTLSLKNLQLKANVITAHNYLTFGEEKVEDLLTAEELLNAMLGED